MVNNELKITIRPKKIVGLIVVISIMLVILSISGLLIKFLMGYPTAKGFVPLFNLDGEANVPTHFSALLMFCNALLCMVISILRKKQGKPEDMKWWFILSLCFLYMSFDEISQIHELLIPPIRNMLGDTYLGIFHNAWVIPFIIIVFLMGALMFKFFFSLPKNIRLSFLFAAIIYIGGAIGIEMIGGSFAKGNGQENLMYNWIVTIEEVLELIGLTWFLRTLLKYIEDTFQNINFSIVSN